MIRSKSSAFAFAGSVGCEKERHMYIPIPLILSNHLSKHGIEGSVKPFNCSIGTWFIRCCTNFIDLKPFTNILKQGSFEAGTLIGQDLTWATKSTKYFFN